ncbi:T9SS type A sorting domain-containing protein, partial [Flavobacterium sp. ZS1P14]|uniref:T9SS type A sorting domain-containing protein n=1 Tax=Flavobacterium sp. ZS1P14 TaxID=3401729 RepID=UPI003AAEE3A7
NPSGNAAAFTTWLASFSGSDTCGTATVTNDSTGLSDLCGATGTETVTFTLTDLCGNSITKDATFTIIDTTVPTFTRPADITIYTDATCGYDATVTATGDVTNEADNCSTGLQASFTDVVTNGSCQGSKVITRTWHLVDNCANAAADQVQIITIRDNTAPTFTRPVDKTIYTSATCTYDASVIVTGDVTNEADNCSTGLNSTFTDVVTNGSCQGSKVIKRTWHLVDNCTNAAADQVQTITVLDTTIPTFTRPADITIYTDATCGYDATVTATGDVTNEADNCSTGLQASFTDVVTNGSCQGSKVITRTWHLVDNCANAAVDQVQIITIRDNTAPTFTRPVDKTIYTSATCTYDASVIVTGDVTNEADNCSTGLNSTFTDVVTNGSCQGSKVIKRTWHLVDNCTNAAADQVQTITVLDTTAPTFTRPVDKTIYTTATCTYDASVIVTGDVTNEADNCSTGLNSTFTDVVTNGSCLGSKVIKRTWHLVDNCTNAAADQVQTITVLDTTAPTFTRPVDKTIYTTATCTYDASVIVTGDVTNEADNCSTGLNSTFTDVVTNGSCLGSKVIKRTWHLVDNCGNLAIDQVQTITISDNITPSITCTANKSVVPNNASCTYKHSGTAWNATATDNCSSTVIKYTLSGATTSTTGAYTTLDNVIFNTGETTVTAVASDACGNNSTCNFTVTVTKTLDVTVNNNNPQLYYGYSLDQSSIIKGTPSGGVAPYKICITMSKLDMSSRILNCNVVSSSGNENWTASIGSPAGSAASASVGNTCPASGSSPISTATNVPVGGSYSVTATLMANARFTVTVTDAIGCTVSKTTDVYSEDDRCFAGNSGNAKVKICHRTGNSNDPCHELCVDQSAVQSHLDHGDYIGSCLPLCVTPTIHTKMVKLDKKLVESTPFDVIAYPNPTDHQFTLIVEGGSDEKVEVLVYDSLGRMVKHIDNSDGQQIKFGDGLPSGAYIAIVSQGINQKTIRLIKE